MFQDVSRKVAKDLEGLDRAIEILKEKEKKMSKKKQEQATELEYLRYFYENVDSALGPASDEIYEIIGEDFEYNTGKKRPEGYYYDDEDDEDY